MEYIKFIKKLINFICILTIILIINKNNIVSIKYKIKTENIIKKEESIDYIEINNYKLLVEKGNEEEILSKNKVYYMPNSTNNNCFLAGHNSKLVFNRIYYLNITDEILLHINNNDYRYEVIDKKYINVSDNSIFLKKAYDSLTLITCSFTNQKRYIVLCKKKE